MRFPLTILLIFAFHQGTCQRLDTEYRTTGDQPVHFLTFIDKVNCRLTFPTHGHVVMTKRLNFDFNYKLHGDTILFSGTNLDTSNLVVQRFLNSRFVKKSDRILYDFVSGYAYVDKQLINDKHTVYSIEGEIFRQNSGHKARGTLRRKLNETSKNADLYSVNILKGKAAYDKYGVIGMNGVIEIWRKK